MMTISEIRERYEKMDPSTDRMLILSELNDCTKAAIKEIVFVPKEKDRKLYTPWTKKEEACLMRPY